MITRDTSEQAWAQAAAPARRARPGRDRTGPGHPARPRSPRASGGWSRCTAAGPTRSRCTPNLWAGVGLVRGGAGTALVGSHEEVADRIAEYHALGIDEFILSGYPHLEEAYQVGEGVMPVLRRRGLLPQAASPHHDNQRLEAVR